MRILGIDYGEKRVGLALSDESQTFARELAILSPKDFFNQINQIIHENQVDQIVLGWPLNMNGEETKKTKEVAEFKIKLEQMTNLAVHTADERLSSVMAEKIVGKKKDLDSLAAQILLQNWLNSSRSVDS